MKFIYDTPFDLFDELERKELIRITRKSCPGCTSKECHAPNIIIPNKEEFKTFLISQIQKSEAEIEKLGLEQIKESDETTIRAMYMSLKIVKELEDNPRKILDIMGIAPSDFKGLSNLLKDIGLDNTDPFTDLFKDDQ